VAGVPAACAARSDARVRAISVAGALKIYWEQVPNSYTKFWIRSNCGTPDERFLQEQFLQQNKNLLFFFSGGGKTLLGQRLRRGLVIRWNYWWYIFELIS
jgi:hypothetical protein